MFYVIALNLYYKKTKFPARFVFTCFCLGTWDPKVPNAETMERVPSETGSRMTGSNSPGAVFTANLGGDRPIPHSQTAAFPFEPESGSYHDFTIMHYTVFMFF